MIGTKHYLHVLSSCNYVSPIHIVDGTTLPILDEGVICVSPTLDLHDVLYVPKFHVSILSISQLTKNFNHSMTFHLTAFFKT